MLRVIFGLILIDQITKWFFATRDFFIGPVHFMTVKNYGLPFGLNFGRETNMVIILAALGFFIAYYVWHRRILFINFAFTLILAGAIANLVDRLYLGYVRDFISLNLGFTFNFADAFIVAGLIGWFFVSGSLKSHEF